jgi:hypothetical protein
MEPATDAPAVTVCTAVASNLGLKTSCTCALTDGVVEGKVSCTQPIDLGIGEKGKFSATFALDLEPCASPASIAMTATFIHVAMVALPSITKTFDVNVDPGSVDISLAAIGIPGFFITVGYDLKAASGALAVKVTLDVCVAIPFLGNKCFSDIPFSTLDPTSVLAQALASLNDGSIPEPPTFPLQVLDVSWDETVWYCFFSSFWGTSSCMHSMISIYVRTLCFAHKLTNT